jgi:purine-binding chemotaxis protein CheW
MTSSDTAQGPAAVIDGKRPADAVVPATGHAAQETAPAPVSVIRSASQEEKKRILRERAIKLAHPPEEDDKSQQFLEVIEFWLAHERYAVEVEFVREVYPLKDLTPVPCTPPFVLGIINIRGQIVSVTDIKQFFDLPKKAISDQSRVLILKNHKMELGILADMVVGERKLPLADIQTDMPSFVGQREHYVRGVTQDRLVVMNADKFLSDDAIVVHQEVGE